MADPTTTARLRDVLSDEFLSQLEAKARDASNEAAWQECNVPDGRRGEELDAYSERVACAFQRDSLIAALLPLLGSLQEEQMREMREALTTKLRQWRDGAPLFETMMTLHELAKDGAFNFVKDGALTRLSPTSAAEGEKE